MTTAAPVGRVFTPPPAAGAAAEFRCLAVDVRGGDFRVRAREGYRPVR